MAPDLKRLRATFSDPARRWILDRLRRRLERGEALVGTITHHRATRAERASLDRLLGRPPSRGKALTLRLEELESLLRHAEQSDTLRDAVIALLGPVVDRRAQRSRLEARWERVFVDLAQSEVRPQIVDWLAERRTRLLTRRYAKQDPDEGRALLERALRVLGVLPVCGLPLAEVAARLVHDSHALDYGRPLGTLILSAAARLGGLRDWHGADGRRDVWASVGVLLDELSAPVLTLNLRADTASLTGRVLRLHAEAGEPCRLSTRQLLRHPAAFDPAAQPVVYVCENPAVVAAAAARLAACSAPLVCIEGQPKTAARLLLNQLLAAGVRLAYHGDFDWVGVRIANLVMERHEAIAWRFDAAAYRSTRGGQTLSGPPVDASWDPELRSAMLESGRAVHEEQVIEDLLEDLSKSRRAPGEASSPTMSAGDAYTL